MSIRLDEPRKPGTRPAKELLSLGVRLPRRSALALRFGGGEGRSRYLRALDALGRVHRMVRP